ncbi:MAG TPA: LytTR family DNA-binding domain-containing protein [Terriglobales bacterium]|nr:LytTR family DNA-binding domain-containing protein [Terriglobales bacterium]
MTRAVVVDDEPLARQVLREMLAGMAEVILVAECANGFEAVKAVHDLKPDLLLLDIQMPKLDGFEVLDLLGSDAPAVVFVTAHDAHALRAFEVQAVDYLLKPFTAERLATALGRALQRGRAPAVARAGYLERIAVRDGATVTIIPVARLDYAEAQDDYVGLVSAGKTHLKAQTIASLESALDPAEFVRIHRSYIVRLERVARLESHGKDGHTAVLDTGVKLPVSRSGYARLKLQLER